MRKAMFIGAFGGWCRLCESARSRIIGWGKGAAPEQSL